MKQWLFLVLLAGRVHAITTGQGPAIGTDKHGTVWYQEFQDWSSNGSGATMTFPDRASAVPPKSYKARFMP